MTPLTRFALLVLGLLLAGCASDKYSKMPEPEGDWTPANVDTVSPASQATR